MYFSNELKRIMNRMDNWTTAEFVEESTVIQKIENDKLLAAVPALGASKESISITAEKSKIKIDYTSTILDKSSVKTITLTVPKEFQTDGMEAELKEGILYLTLQKASERGNKIIVK